MAAMLRDGGDLDSADRSMLDAESVHERMFRSGLGLSLRADILSLDPGALSLMSGLSGLDGVSLHSLDPLQRLKCPPDPGHGPPPLIMPDPAHRGSHVRTMATKEWDKT